MNLETDSGYVIKMVEAMKSAAMPGKQNEGYVEAVVLSKGASGAVGVLP